MKVIIDSKSKKKNYNSVSLCDCNILCNEGDTCNCDGQCYPDFAKATKTTNSVKNLKK